MQVTEALTTANPPFSKNSKAEQEFVWSIAEALTAIIDALAEAHDEAFEAIVRNHDIVHFLFVLLSLGFTTASVYKNAMLCLMTLSEDSRQFVEAIIADEITKTYQRLTSLQRGGGYKAVIACGILHNVFAVMEWHDQNPGKGGVSDAVLVPTLSQSLEKAQLSSNMTNGHGSSSPADILQLALEILASIGTTLQESLEKRSKAEWGGIVDKDDKDDDDDDDDVMDADVDSDDADEPLSENEDPSADKDDEEDDEMDEDEMEADMEMVTGADDHPDEGVSTNIDDLPTLKELLHKAIPQALKIAQKTDIISRDEEASTAIRTHAFATLNNISWTVSCIDFSDGQSAPILRVWRPIARTIWREAVVPILASDTSDIGLATVVTSLAWAVARTLHIGNTAPFLAGDEHKKFISLYHASKGLNTNTNNTTEQEKKEQQQQGANVEDPFQSLGVKCIGVLGQLALDPAPTALNRELGVFLVTVVSALPETPVADAVEALNQLFDIYGDEKKACDQEVFWQDGFLAHFEAAVPKFRAAVKRVDKGKSAELRQRADETLMNLTRFIQYKQKHRP